MNSSEILIKWKNNNPQIENVVLFVSDSLRWDYLPFSISKRGIIFKTIASSAFTASSFPSIITGLYPQHHNVFSFFDKIPYDLQTLLNLPGYNTSLWLENTWIDERRTGQSELHRLLNCREAIPLNQIQPPFIYLEDEKGGHCPYGWTEDDIYKEIDCRKFFKDYGKKSKKELKERYQSGINRSVREFDKRLEILKKRNLLDKTLIIFLSDHGELLGEYGGIIGHGSPTTPEIVFVPTVFIHQNLPQNVSFEKDGVLRHVDLFPSITDLLNVKRERYVDGTSLFSTEKLPERGINYYKTEIRTPIVKYQLTEKSVWDKNGGYLFRDGSNFLIQLLYGIYDITISKRVHALYLRGQLQQMKFKMIRNYLSILRNSCFSQIRYGNPGFDFDIAQEIIKKIKEMKIFVDEKQQIKKTIEKLKKQGKV